MALGVVVGLGLGGWLAVRSISAAICADYNSISNDFCDEWHYDTPPEDALPQVRGWTEEWSYLSCGSGGCPDRIYVVSSDTNHSGVGPYLKALSKDGWELRSGESQTGSSTLRRGNVELGVSDAETTYLKTLIPERLRRSGFVVVAVTLIDN